MKLSEYCDRKTNSFLNVEYDKVSKFIEYINSKIDDDLYEIAKAKDSVGVYKKLVVWLLKCYSKELFDGLKYVEVDIDLFKKSLINSFILSVTRNKTNSGLIYDVLKANGIIEKMLVYEDNYYEIFTKDFGVIQFVLADEAFKNDKETLEYMKNMGDRVLSGCHDVSFYLIKEYEEFKAVTAICMRNLYGKYYHSFVLDDNDNVIDFTSNLVMPKEQYYSLNNVEEINCISHKEYLEEKDKSIKFDESKTLFPLLRNALYKQYLLENDSNVKKM